MRALARGPSGTLIQSMPAVFAKLRAFDFLRCVDTAGRRISTNATNFPAASFPPRALLVGERNFAETCGMCRRLFDLDFERRCAGCRLRACAADYLNVSGRGTAAYADDAGRRQSGTGARIAPCIRASTDRYCGLRRSAGRAALGIALKGFLVKASIFSIASPRGFWTRGAIQADYSRRTIRRGVRMKSSCRTAVAEAGRSSSMLQLRDDGDGRRPRPRARRKWAREFRSSPEGFKDQEIDAGFGSAPRSVRGRCAGFLETCRAKDSRRMPRGRRPSRRRLIASCFAGDPIRLPG